MRRTFSALRLRQHFAFLLTFAFATSTAGAAPRGASTHLVTYGADQFAHGAGWERVAGHYDGRYLGSSLRSYRPGARATLDFEGTTLLLYGVLGVGGGIGIVSIDGKVADVMNFFASRKVTHWIVYASPRLPRGAHRLTVEVVRPSRDPKAKLGFVNIDSATVVP